MTSKGPISSGESAALSRDLADFLIELSIGLHKNSIYPPGHPLLDGAVRGVERRLTVLLDKRDSISLGVARNQLVIEGVATDPENPLLRELAGRLHRHQLGAIRFAKDATPDEIRVFLATVAVEPQRTDRPLGLEPPEVLHQWSHIRLYPMTFDQLELVEEGADKPVEAHEAGDTKGGSGKPDTGARSRAAQLWVGLARAAMATGTGAADEPPPSTDPVVVAQAIDDSVKDVAYDQVVVGYLLQIAEELKRAHGQEALALQRRISKLVRALRPETLRRLMDMGGDVLQRKRFALDTSQGLAVDAVVELVQAAADTSKQTVSHSMMRLLSKFAVHAEQDAGDVRGEFEGALREHVHKLISDWKLDDPNPDAYRQALEQMSQSAPLFTTSDQAFPPEPERMIQMALEVGTVGEALWRAVDARAGRDNFLPLLDLLDRAPESQIRTMIWERITTEDRLRTLLAGKLEHRAQVERLIAKMGLAAAAPLLDAIEAADEQAARPLSELLLSLGKDVAPMILSRMDGARWANQRRLLALLAQIPETPSHADAADYLQHADPDVRREALRCALRSPASRSYALSIAMSDADPRMVFTALNAALGDCPPDAVPGIMRKVDDPDIAPELRQLGIRVMASMATEETLLWLVQRALGKKRALRRQGLAPKSPELLAILTAVAGEWRDHPDAARLMALARTSDDPEIRGAVAARPSQVGVRVPRTTVEFMRAVQTREEEEAAAREAAARERAARPEKGS